MNPDNAFERCLASLYEAALDDTRWPVASGLVEEAVGFHKNALVVGEVSENGVRLTFARFLERGDSREDLGRAYFDAYYRHDEAVPRIRRLPHGRLVHTPDLYTQDELKTSPVYNEGLRRMGGHEGLLVRFDGPEGLGIIWGAGNPVGGVWQQDRLRLLERLLPHLYRSVLIRQEMAAADALGAGLEGLLENDRIGAMHLDRGGRVLEANSPALEILRLGDGLLESDGVLDAGLPADRSRLRRLVGRALPGLWGEAPVGGSMTIQRSSGRSRLGLHVSPVGDSETDFGGRRVAALVLVVDPARRPRINAARVAAMLGLTPSEGRMSALLAEGLKVREIAAVAGWSEDYVRWLTKQVYRKLGATGQVDLVRLVLAANAVSRR